MPHQLPNTTQLNSLVVRPIFQLEDHQCVTGILRGPEMVVILLKIEMYPHGRDDKWNVKGLMNALRQYDRIPAPVVMGLPLN